MHPFDWGVFKPWGELILFGSAGLYCFAVWLSIRRWIMIISATRKLYLTIPVSLIVLGLMIWQAGRSVFWQMTSAHYQENIHMLALATIVSGLTVSLTIANISNKKVNKSMERDAHSSRPSS